MSANSEHIKTGKLKSFSKAIWPVGKEIYPLSVVRKLSNEPHTNKEEEEVIPFDNLKMPVQPQGYIKCPRYDFF